MQCARPGSPIDEIRRWAWVRVWRGIVATRPDSAVRHPAGGDLEHMSGPNGVQVAVQIRPGTKEWLRMLVSPTTDCWASRIVSQST